MRDIEKRLAEKMNTPGAMFVVMECAHCGDSLTGYPSLQYCSEECEREAWAEMREDLNEDLGFDLPATPPHARVRGRPDPAKTDRMITMDVAEWAMAAAAGADPPTIGEWGSWYEDERRSALSANAVKIPAPRTGGDSL